MQAKTQQFEYADRPEVTASFLFFLIIDIEEEDVGFGSSEEFFAEKRDEESDPSDAEALHRSTLCSHIHFSTTKSATKTNGIEICSRRRTKRVAVLGT